MKLLVSLFSLVAIMVVSQATFASGCMDVKEGEVRSVEVLSEKTISTTEFNIVGEAPATVVIQLSSGKMLSLVSGELNTTSIVDEYGSAKLSVQDVSFEVLGGCGDYDKKTTKRYVLSIGSNNSYMWPYIKPYSVDHYTKSPFSYSDAVLIK